MKISNDRSGCPELSGEALERHLFVCEDCRAQARLAAAWRFLAAEGPEEAPVREEFLARVLGARRRGVLQDRRFRYFLAAAALLLFCFFAGSGHRSRTGQPSDRQAEEALATVASPAEFESLLPD
jgi:predicted anti-sigma-YlaC factor YlaD